MNAQRLLRITHVDTGMSLRGGQRQLLLLARGLRARGHDQLLVCQEGSGLEDRACQEGFRVFTLPAHDPAHAFGILRLRQQLVMSAVEILHAHDGRGHTVAWLASLGLPVRRIATRRVTFFPADRWTYRLKYARTCHAVVAVSDYIRDLAAGAGVPRERIEVIPDGIELPPDLPGDAARSRLRNAWELSEEAFVVGQLGAFTPEKGHDVALDALALVAAKLPHARLVLAGEGSPPAAGALAQRIDRLGARVRLLDAVEDLADFFPGLDLLIMPSKAEGLGSSALLAMAYGLPVVANRVGGLPEVVLENETGWLVPPGSPQALADAIILAASDRDRLVQFGRQGRKRAEGFSADIMVGRTEALYQRLASGGGHRQS
jgi:glycosyltransferase involved in cell wall biosynthesis